MDGLSERHEKRGGKDTGRREGGEERGSEAALDVVEC